MNAFSLRTACPEVRSPKSDIKKKTNETPHPNTSRRGGAADAHLVPVFEPARIDLFQAAVIGRPDDQLPETKVLILTSFGMANDLSKALANGAAGALLKNSAISELVGAIRAVVVDGKRVISPDIELILASEPPIPDLSARQMQILDSIARGLSNEQIAEQYDLSLGSVKTHIEKLLAKIGAANRAEAAGIALRRHLLKT